ncbi:MAG TPA: prephenate/arogenate dehydrogenase family protein [Geminicoccaceae bacterium]|nr:prephenate/arogenate dehydrogenase family protein [Geminicoccus sp.]HMU48478.1 prephenate/arogenate dehydrogenase family protein [Geminicoccaceae bacterium]
MSRIDRLALIGVGLINGSLALSLRQRGLVGEITGCARNDLTRARAVELGICDRAFADPADAVRDAQVVVLGVPPAACGPVAERIRAALPPDAIVTDVGSIKGQIVRDVVPHLRAPTRFVPGHPVAGTEHSGPDAAFAGLFDRRRVILTPIEDTDPEATARIRGMWEGIGALVDSMTPEHHDRVLAITSHLPHLIAYTIVGTVADLEDQARTEVFRYAAGGFTDFTRIAASDPTMWRDVFLNNREAVLEMLGRFTEDLVSLQRAIRWGEGDKLFDLFTRTRAIRRGVIQAGEAYRRLPSPAEADGKA